jgi:hypothetical protein
MTMAEVAVAGILFSRSVRSTFVSLTLAVPSAHQLQYQGTITHHDPHPILVRIQFQDNIKDLRSFCRKHYKLGDYLEIWMSPKGRWQTCSPTLSSENGSHSSTNNIVSWSQQARWVVDVDSIPATKDTIHVVTSQVWNMTQCQKYQHRYLSCSPNDTKRTITMEAVQPLNNHKEGRIMLNSNQAGEIEATKHGGGIDKRRQAEQVVEFFLKQMGKQFSLQLNTDAKDDLANYHQQVRIVLNQGSGVLDIAGGSGYVSLALALKGIQSTVIDTRSGVGKLPGKDRKFWKRRLQQQALQQMQESRLVSIQSTDIKKDRRFMKENEPTTIIPFQIHRAWFGSRPPGVDQSFRNPDKEDLPTISIDAQDSLGNSSYPLLRQASALIALHPDEATADIVQAAVKYRIPFMVVPCCVFARLFPDRRMSNGGPVSTYEDLLEYLQKMDASIQRSSLPLEGRNIVLWSTFEGVNTSTNRSH